MWLNINTSTTALFITSILLLSCDISSQSEQRIDLTGVWAEIATIFHKFQKECPTCMEFFNNITNIDNNIHNLEPSIIKTSKSEIDEEKLDLPEKRYEISGVFSPFHKECPACVEFLNKAVNMQDAIRTSRLESIKKAILEGLGMTEPPKIDASQLSIPFPIRNGDILSEETIYEEVDDEDSSVNHPSRVVVVSSGTRCRETEYGYDITFKIEMPWNVHTGELTEAKLWLYTDSETNINKCNLYSRPCSDGPPDNFNDVYIDGNDFKDGWTQLDITSPFNNWLEYEEFCQEITVSCNDQINEFYRSTYFNDSTKQPFIVANLLSHASVNRNRNKRNINCVPNSTECCREKLVVSFAQIKWDDWIIHPPTYDAYYCKGKCDDVATVSLGHTPYNSVLHKLRMKTEEKDKLPELSPCCAPTRMSSLQILFAKQNHTYESRIIPDMSVLSCGCT